MNKTNKKRANRSNAAQTILERAKREIPDFVEHYAKFEQPTTINGYAPSTIFNYSRAVAKISLYFGKLLLDLDADEVHPFFIIWLNKSRLAALILSTPCMGFVSFSGCTVRKAGC